MWNPCSYLFVAQYVCESDFYSAIIVCYVFWLSGTTICLTSSPSSTSYSDLMSPITAYY